MREVLKPIIYDFLISNAGKKFAVRHISQELKISYSTTLKWIEVLVAEGKVKCEDWKNIKLVWVDKP